MTHRLLLLSFVAFLSGVILAERYPESWSPVWVLTPVPLCFLFRKRQLGALLAVSLLTGLFYSAAYQAHQRPTLDAWVGQEVELRGRVAQEPTVKVSGTSFTLEVTAVRIGTAWRQTEEKAVVRLRETRGGTVRAGDLLSVERALLEKPVPPRNPGAFDAKSFYGRQGIFYSLSLTAAQLTVTGHDEKGLSGRFFLPLRQRLLLVLNQQFSPQHAAVFAGLLFGITENIDQDLIETFRVLGVVHILAVSGANVAMITVPFLLVLKKWQVPARPRYTLTILLVLLYAGITGWEPSVTRAAVMAILLLVARMLTRAADPLTAWALAGWIALLLHPQIWQDLGFQLTMIITLGLLLIPSRLEKRFPRIPRSVLFTLTAELMSVPLVLSVSPVWTPLSLLANLYLMPLLAALVPLGLVTVLLGLVHPAAATLPALLAKWGLQGLFLDPLQRAGASGIGVTHVQAPPVWWLAVYYSMWILYASGRLKHRWRQGALFGLAFLLAAGLLWRSYGPAPLTVTYLDVGQGDAILIQTPQRHVWLVDGGGVPGFLKTDYDVGEKVVVPALASQGIDEIDVLVITHPDEDHIKGLGAVLKHVHVRHIITSFAAQTSEEAPFYRELIADAKRRGIAVTNIQKGDRHTPEPGLEVLYHNPPGQPFQNTRSDSNANSIVFSMIYGQRHFLFTADLEGEVERRLGSLPRTDVLKVAHHGSAHSTTPEFLRMVRPRHAVLSAGARNRYGHPAPAVVERLTAAGSTVWRTDRQGAIRCQTDGEELKCLSWAD